jgi:hypothetical protein
MAQGNLFKKYLKKDRFAKKIYEIKKLKLLDKIRIIKT